MKLLLGLFIFLGTNAAWALPSLCDQGYAPEFTEQELVDISHWSTGIAIMSFANRLGISFNKEALKKDCPNWAAYGYARTQGPQCLHGIDVERGYISAQYVLTSKYNKMLGNEITEEEFMEYFFEKAQQWGFAHYMAHGQQLVSN